MAVVKDFRSSCSVSVCGRSSSLTFENMATHNLGRKYAVQLLLLVVLMNIAYLSLSASGAPGVAADSAGSTQAYNDQVLVAASCSPKPIPQGSAYWGHVGALLAYLVQEAPYTDHLSLKARYGGGNAPAFGLATCSASASPSNCQSCLQALSSDIWRICNSALAARVQYKDCYLGYADYNFSS